MVMGKPRRKINMSKNMTKKGLAFGAGFALVASGLAGLPANAVGITGFIPVAPTSGPATALAIQTGDGASFSVTATPVSTTMAGSGTLKYLVTDPEAKFTPGVNSTVGYTQAATTGIVAATTAGRLQALSVATETITLQVAAGTADGPYIVYANDVNLDVDDADGTPVARVLTKDALTTGYVYNGQLLLKAEGDIVANIDRIEATTSLTLVGGGKTTASATTAVVAENVGATYDGTLVTITPGAPLAAGQYLVSSNVAIVVDDSDINPDTVVAAGEKFILNSDGTDYTFTSDAGAAAATPDATANAFTLTVHSLDAVRSTVDNSFVVDTRVTTAGTAAAIEMIATDAVTRSVTVQAFVDDFADNTIGAGEYISAETTLNFVAQADISFTSNLDAPKPGDDKLTGYVTTTPLINDLENDIVEWAAGVFTRQESITSAIVFGGTQSLTTGRWPVEVALATPTAVTVWTNSTTDVDATGEKWATAYAGTGPGTVMANPNTVDTETITRTKIVVASKVATVTTYDGATEADTSPHLLRVGDKVKFENDADASALVRNLTFTVTAVPTTSSFQIALDTTDGVIQALADGDHTQFIVATWADNVSTVDRVFAGDYTLTSAVLTSTANRYAAKGVASGLGAQAAVADDVIFTTEASASVQGRTVSDQAGATDVVVQTGTTTVTVKATVVDEDDVAVGANRPVVYTVSRGANTTIKVNGLTTGDTLRTDANGQVTFTITDTNGADGKAVTISATAEGVALSRSDITVAWADAAYQMYDLATTDATLGDTIRNIAKGSSYNLNLLVADQWLTIAPSEDYQVAVSGSGVVEGVATLTDGKATVTVTDASVLASYNTVLTLQKKGTTGVFANTTTSVTIAHAVNANPALTLGAAGSTLYGSAVVTTAAVAKVALVELDKRVDLKTVTPLYVNKAVVNGKATNGTTGVGLPGSVVTITGPSNILFENGQVAQRGTLTAVANQTTGNFEFNLYSTSAQKDTVITVTANGVSKEVKVTFTGIGVGEGVSLVVTTPAAVKPASTFQVKAKLADTFGNGVVAAAGRVKVTYTGAGIVFGTLPTSTDANGELMFSVLLGSNDTGTVSVTVSYDQNGDTDFVDAKDLNTTSTTEITASGVVASAAKVNVGSFKGYVALYAKGYAGQKMSAIVAGKWIVVASLASDFERVVRFTGAGYTITTKIYIDGVQIGSEFTTVTK
jgi:hypothetical protein